MSSPSNRRDPIRRSGLVYVTDHDPGIRRRPHGKGFQYVDSANRAIHTSRELQRISALAIPPAYREVWICKHARGHLQATGRDARGRKQYRYHVLWRAARDQTKFDRLKEFGNALPKLRKHLKRDLALKGLPRPKVLAVLATLLDTTHVRVGNVEYARENGSFGLATLRDRHIRFVRQGRILLNFRGKSGKQHDVRIDSPRLAKILRRCQELPGQQLFQYVGEDGGHYAITSQDVNAYLREAMGIDVTSKDFRTWAATFKAIALLARTALPDPMSNSEYSRVTTAVVKQVAEELRNTPAVCRKSYINPRVFELWRSGLLQKKLAAKMQGATPKRMEKLALSFIGKHFHSH